MFICVVSDVSAICDGYVGGDDDGKVCKCVPACTCSAQLMSNIACVGFAHMNHGFKYALQPKRMEALEAWARCDSDGVSLRRSQAEHVLPDIRLAGAGKWLYFS